MPDGYVAQPILPSESRPDPRGNGPLPLVQPTCIAAVEPIAQTGTENREEVEQADEIKKLPRTNFACTRPVRCFSPGCSKFPPSKQIGHIQGRNVQDFIRAKPC